MIVDDMEVMRRQIKRLALWGENTGFHIIDEAEDGQEALIKLKRQPVDLLITDIKMPRVDGMELLKETYENDLATCVVFLSEYGEFNFAKEAIQYDIFDYLVKPVQDKELKMLLEKVKNHIKEKEQTEVHLKKLESKLMDKIDVYYPTNNLIAIIKYISIGNKKAIEATVSMVEETATALEYDKLKVAIVLEKAFNEIWMEVRKNHDWLEQFVDTTTFATMGLTHYKDIDSMTEKVVEMTKLLISIINTYIIGNRNNPIINQICMYVINNIERKINMSSISEALFLSKNYIGDVFKEETGMTVGQYITMVKIQRAKHLILNDMLKNYEVAQRLGYNDVEYFGKTFKKITGLSPAEFRKTTTKK